MQDLHGRLALIDEFADDQRQEILALERVLFQILGQPARKTALGLIEKAPAEAPQVHADGGVQRQVVPARAAVLGVVDTALVCLDAGALGDAVQGAVRVRDADAAGNAAVLGDGVLQQVADHAVVVDRAVRVGGQVIVDDLERLRAVVVICIDDRERAVDEVFCRQDRVAGAPGLDAALRDGEACGQLIQLLECVFHVHHFGHAVADGLFEGLLDLMLDDEDHGLKACTAGIVEGIIHDDLPVGAYRVDLLHAAVTAAHASRHDHQYRFVHVLIPPAQCAFSAFIILQTAGVNKCRSASCGNPWILPPRCVKIGADQITNRKGVLFMYTASSARYSTLPYHRCGQSGLLLPAVSLGFWHNFGDTAHFETMKQLCFTAFDHGITHFDLANNYGPAPGSAEKNLGRILKENFRPYRDELIISTKAGYEMWDGPYGNWGSRKYLLASLDQSLERLGLDYVDIFYHHRMDPNTPLEETMGALEQAVRSGKALYAGLSNYDGPTLEKACAILTERHVPFVLNQNRYSIFDRTIEKNGLKETANRLGKGIIAFSPLAQGLLTDRYLHGIPEDSRIRTDGRFLKESTLTEEKLEQIRALNAIAAARGQTLAEMALAWILKDGQVTSVLIGASRPEQILDDLKALDNTAFTPDELRAIDAASGF